MDISIYLAKVFGIYLIIVPIAVLINRKHFKELLDDFSKNSSFVFFSGIIHLILGLFVVIAHNIWTNDWRIIITLLAWAGILKGIIRIMFPFKIARWVSKIKDIRKFWAWCFIMILLGIYLTYIGFIV